jgi:hypothetical protein
MRLGLSIAVLLVSSFTAYGQDCTTLDTCRQILETRPKSSIAHYRIAEIHFARKEYQKAANTFRLALDGDLDPKWVKVWSYVSLGKEFEAVGEQGLQYHGHFALADVCALCLRFDVISVRCEPTWPTRNLIVLDAVCHLNQLLHPTHCGESSTRKESAPTPSRHRAALYGRDFKRRGSCYLGECAPNEKYE